MDSYKDPKLKGKFVKRCKCGSRPYSDRIYMKDSYWIQCNCGRVSISSTTLNLAIENWNEDKLKY